MKIINLSFNNINSLAGAWSIDFENPAFSEGLFALTGPTGAGKTSVLDAICLALYGKTVREDISKEHNEVMTRGTGQCYAEVTFEVECHRYRCRWSQDRAHGKPEGALQNAVREIVDATTGAVIASQIRLVETKIIELTGMSFDQFTRAVLLAQGQFDTFLKAKDSERADILEKITNTGIFSKIGDVVFTRFQEEKRKKENLESAQAAIAVMTSEDREQLDAQFIDAKNCRTVALAELVALANQLNWLNTLADLQKVQAEITAQKVALDTRRTTSQPDLDKLAVAESARKFDLDLQSLDNDRASHTKTTKELANRRTHSADMQAKQTAIVPQLTLAAQLAETAKQNLENALPKLAEIRKIDKQINLAEQDKKNAEATLADAEQHRKEAANSQTQATNNHTAAKSDLKKATDYQQDHALDGKIGELLPPIETKHSAWEILKRNAVAAQITAIAKEQEAATADKKVTDAVAKNQADEEAAIKAKAELDAKLPKLKMAEVAKETAETAKEKSEAAWHKQRPSLEQQCELAERKLRLVQQVANLEARRQQLVDGAPCPLCGSIEHPYASGEMPELSDAEKELRAIKTKMADLEKVAIDAREQHDTSVKAMQKQLEIVVKLTEARDTDKNNAALSALAAHAAADTAQTTRKLAGDANVDAKTASDESEKAWSEISAKLAELAVPNPQIKDLASIVIKLKTRQSDFDAQDNVAQSATVRIQEALKAIEGAAQRVRITTSTLTDKQTELTKKTVAFVSLSEARKTQYGDINPDIEEKRLRTANEQAEKDHAAIVKEKATLDQAMCSAVQEVETAQKQLDQTVLTLQSAVAAGAAKWQSAGFPDETACRAARWADSEIVRVTNLRKELETQNIELKTNRATNDAALAAERAKALTDRSSDELSVEISSKQTAREAEDAVLKDLDFKVRTDIENRDKRAAQGSALETQKAVFARWKKLNDMIGNDGGVRFKKYAQGITLNRLLKVANPHLASMTNNRYALLWNVNDGDDLLPVIIDNHQAEAKRPTSNLSGGETFMVSLALALGLSGMASGKLQVDSLFLDEGFGTLDNEALDRAIGTLNQLHQSQGKLIGVISHIDQLKNQINTKIEVTKIGNGRSKLSGTGVERLAASSNKPSKDEITSSIPKKELKKRGRSAKIEGNLNCLSVC